MGGISRYGSSAPKESAEENETFVHGDTITRLALRTRRQNSPPTSRLALKLADVSRLAPTNLEVDSDQLVHSAAV
jgi:hypothetical protein